MSCVVSTKVGGGEGDGASCGVTHFEVRALASSVVSEIVDKYR